MTRHYVDRNDPHLGHYEVYTGEKGARWRFHETGWGTYEIQSGPWVPTVADAYRDAANDWESNGNSANRRLSGQLRAAATRAEKKA